MKEETNGWVVVAKNHPTNNRSWIVGSTFRRTRKESISEFIDGSGSSWKYWYQKYNFRCVKASNCISLSIE